MTDTLLDRPHPAAARRPRVGFLGVGWIGRHRMEAMIAEGGVEAVAVADASETCLAEALALSPEALACVDLEQLLDLDLDGLVIATPSALHAEQAIQALERGVAVFCQKPLGRNEAETRAVVDAARRADRLLAVDLSYRRTAAVEAIREQLNSGALGSVHVVDLTFHNAYGPDKAWFYDPALSGGGCVMDLGVHLVDLALWLLDEPVVRVESHLFHEGRPLADRTLTEDFALATLVLASGAAVRLTCSWRLHAGRDAVIEAAFYGDRGGAALRNLGGSFYDFEARVFHGVDSQVIAAPPDAWGGRAATDWAGTLARSRAFDPQVETLVRTASVLDRIYQAAMSKETAAG